MTPNKNYYCLILAGGKGRRLWPYSRQNCPKQFIDFLGTGRTQLQQTYDRMIKLISPENIYISTNINYLDLVQEQLPEVARTNIMPEPIYRNTAPSIAWAGHRIRHLNPRASIIVTPSDQIISNEEAFGNNVLSGLDFVSQEDYFLTMGIRPTRPEPGYGYIQLGEAMRDNVYRVKSFTEKPEREFATIFMESGEFYWNTGLFLTNVKHLHYCFSKLLPVVLDNLDAINYYATPEQEEAFMMQHFTAYPNMSVDMGILEKSDKVCVMKCDFGWADLGTWHSIYEALRKTDDDNVIIDSEVIIEDSKRNVIKLSKGRIGVINGLEGFIVAERGNVLFICKKEDSSDLVRKYINEVQMKKGEDFI